MLNDDPVFNFDLLEPEVAPESGDAVTEASEPVRVMECLCPKCSHSTEINLTEMPTEGSVIQCSACNATIHIVRESCACRAKRQGHEISCANCGSRLGQHIHCNSCGTIFPDYFVPENPDDARRKARKAFFANTWAAFRDLKFSFKPAFSGVSREASHGYTPQRAIDFSEDKPGLFTRKIAMISLAVVVSVALLAAGGLAYKTHQNEKQYVKNYFRALYGIKTGVDSNLKICSAMKTDWEKAATAGVRYSPIISTNDETKSAKLRGEVDKIVKLANVPPKKLAPTKERLLALYAIYQESDTLINSKPNSLQEFSSSIEKLDKKMKVASNELKSSLPESLKQELANAKLKYRAMSDF